MVTASGLRVGPSLSILGRRNLPPMASRQSILDEVQPALHAEALRFPATLEDSREKLGRLGLCFLVRLRVITQR